MLRFFTQLTYNGGLVRRDVAGSAKWHELIARYVVLNYKQKSLTNWFKGFFFKRTNSSTARPLNEPDYAIQTPEGGSAVTLVTAPTYIQKDSSPFSIQIKIHTFQLLSSICSFTARSVKLSWGWLCTSVFLVVFLFKWKYFIPEKSNITYYIENSTNSIVR